MGYSKAQSNVSKRLVDRNTLTDALLAKILMLKNISLGLVQKNRKKLQKIYFYTIVKAVKILEVIQAQILKQILIKILGLLQLIIHTIFVRNLDLKSAHKSLKKFINIYKGILKLVGSTQLDAKVKNAKKHTEMDV